MCFSARPFSSLPDLMKMVTSHLLAEQTFIKSQKLSDKWEWCLQFSVSMDTV